MYVCDDKSANTFGCAAQHNVAPQSTRAYVMNIHLATYGSGILKYI